jgi:hypothetical protein
LGAAFSGLNGDWFWQGANEFDRDHRDGLPLVLTVHRLRNLVVSKDIAESIRYCLDHPPKKRIAGVPKHGFVPGYFFRCYHAAGGKWVQEPPENPEFSRRPSDVSR